MDDGGMVVAAKGGEAKNGEQTLTGRERDSDRSAVHGALHLGWCTTIYTIKIEKTKRKIRSESRTLHLELN